MVANILEWVTAAAAWAQPLGLGGAWRVWEPWASISIPWASLAPPADCLHPPKTGSMPGATATLSSDIYQLGSGHRDMKSGLACGWPTSLEPALLHWVGRHRPSTAPPPQPSSSSQPVQPHCLGQGSRPGPSTDPVCSGQAPRKMRFTTTVIRVGLGTPGLSLILSRPSRDKFTTLHTMPSSWQQLPLRSWLRLEAA